jgi:hypothetical protein
MLHYAIYRTGITHTAEGLFCARVIATPPPKCEWELLLLWLFAITLHLREKSVLRIYSVAGKRGG